MSKVITYGAILIGLFLVVVYYRGASSDAQAGASGIGSIISLLQGRGTNGGSVANYPTGA